jgi:sigma-B regulation protein RsbU (phosphoserine phosphatase)
MTTARALLRGRAAQHADLGETLASVNRLLSQDTPAGRYMTLFYARIDTREHAVSWANAGHDPGILYDPATDTFDELTGGDLPLGIVAEEAYGEYRRDGLSSGQVILIGTDGIWETCNRAGEQFGKERLRQTVREAAAGTAEQIADAVSRGLDEFRDGRPREDDVTMVVLKIV